MKLIASIVEVLVKMQLLVVQSFRQKSKVNFTHDKLRCLNPFIFFYIVIVISMGSAMLFLFIHHFNKNIIRVEVIFLFKFISSYRIDFIHSSGPIVL